MERLSNLLAQVVLDLGDDPRKQRKDRSHRLAVDYAKAVNSGDRKQADVLAARMRMHSIERAYA